MTKLYKVRKIISNNKSGDIFGVSIPKKILKELNENTKCQPNELYVTMSVSGCAIIMEQKEKLMRGINNV